MTKRFPRIRRAILAAATVFGDTPMQKAQFPVAGTTLVGDLYGAEPGAKRPAIAIIGPMTY